MMSEVSEQGVHGRFPDYTVFLRKPFRVAALIDRVRKVLPAVGP